MPRAVKQVPEWYVYQLIDPRTGSPFYIGKGKDGRMYDHVKQVDQQPAHPKNIRINEILALGLEVGHEVVKTFKSESAAYRYEARLIKQIGRDNLTNLTDGGVGAPAWVRAIDPEEQKDITMVGLVSFMARKTAGFTMQPVFWFGGQWRPITSINVSIFKQRVLEIIEARGIEWVNKLAKKDGVMFELSKVEALDGCGV